MKTRDQREKEFREDLAALLEKHGAEIEIQDEGLGYMPRPAIFVCMQSAYDDDLGQTVLEYTEFKL